MTNPFSGDPEEVSPSFIKEVSNGSGALLDLADFVSNRPVLDYLMNLITPKQFWADDKDELYCRDCSKTFFFILRPRHHCRACGHLFCENCSRFFLSLDNIKVLQKTIQERISIAQPVLQRKNHRIRVCSFCFNRIISNLEVIIHSNSPNHPKSFSILPHSPPRAKEPKEKTTKSTNSEMTTKSIELQICHGNLVSGDAWHLPQVEEEEEPSFFVTLAQEFDFEKNDSQGFNCQGIKKGYLGKGYFWRFLIKKALGDFLEFALEPSNCKDCVPAHELKSYTAFMKTVALRVLKQPVHPEPIVTDIKESSDDFPFKISCLDLGPDGKGDLCSMFRGVLVKNKGFSLFRRNLREMKNLSVVFIKGSINFQELSQGFLTFKGRLSLIFSVLVWNRKEKSQKRKLGTQEF